jgi:short-subunit dehydrogenase
MSFSSSQLPRQNETFFSFAGKLALAAATVVAARKILTLRVTQKAAELQGKVVLITGGSRGLGLALAQDLGRQGCLLALCARDKSELDEAVKHLVREGIEAVPFACDVTNQNEVATLIQEVTARFGRIDVLVNNAGLIKVGPFESMQHVDYENAMNLMFWAPVNLTLAVLPQMKKQGGGHIVNISSVGGRVSIPHLLPYSCAKFALVGFSTGLSSELKTEGIHVLTVTPGLMRTGSYLNAEFGGEAQAEFAWFGLLGNLPGFSVAADFAAASIRRAIETHQYTCTISLPAKILIGLEALLPEASRTLCTVANEVLPYAAGGSSTSGKPLDSRFGKLFQALTLLGKRAALNLNE